MNRVTKERNDHAKKYLYNFRYSEMNQYGQAVTRYSYVLGHPLKTRKVNPRSPLMTTHGWYAYWMKQRGATYAETPKYLLRLV